MKNKVDIANAAFLRFENRVGLYITSFIVSLVLIGIAMLYTAPRFEAAYHGLQYSLLSNNPFDFGTPNALRYRILPSLIGYLTFLRGPLFFLVPLIFAFLFFASIYRVYRKINWWPLEAFLTAALISFSCTLFIQLQAPGYTDVVFYFFVFLSFASVQKPYLSALYFALALLTHESCLFLLPALLLYSIYKNKTNWKQGMHYAFLLAVAVIPLLVYRYWVSQYVAVEYNLSFYFSEKNIRFTIEKVLQHLPLGLFLTFKLFWCIPLLAAFLAIKHKNYVFVLLLACILLCDLAQLLIAFDITRMLCLGFPILLISVEELKRFWSEQRLILFLLVLIVLNFCIPQYFMSCDGPIPMNSVFNNAL